jgi:transcription elongation GreA/GreB family factor
MSESNRETSGTKVDVGCWVKVKEEGLDEEETFRIGEVTRPRENQIAPDNAMGKALLGAEPGDEVTVEGPVGPIKFSVLDVGRADGDQ